METVKAMIRLHESGLLRSGKNIWEKSGNFVDGQGNLERTWKVREKSGNLKINGYGRQSPENSFVLYNSGKDVLSLGIV